MAKKTTMAANTNGATVTPISLPGNLRARFSALQVRVLAAGKTFGAIRETLAELAPKVMAMLTSINYERNKKEERDITFAQFARLFDASVPLHAEDEPEGRGPGYKSHRVYTALEYMKRINSRASSKGSRGGETSADGETATAKTSAAGVRAVSVDGLARMIATILAVIPAKSTATVWTAVQAQLGLTNPALTSLQERVSKAEPLLDLSGKISAVKAHKNTAPSTTTAAAAEPMAQAGRQVTLPAATGRAAARTA